MSSMPDTGISAPGSAPPGPAFPATGAAGHRGRMRARLLSRGPDGLGDDEILEMLLFLGVPRRDTRNMAKAALALFGSLGGAVDAPLDALHRAGMAGAGPVIGPGAGPGAAGGQGAAAVFALVRESARRLQRADARPRPVLDGTERLLAHLDVPARLRQPPHLAVLLLNNRNQLLAEQRHADADGPDGADAVAQAVARQAVAVHATALILATCRPAARPAVTERDAAVTGSVRRAAGVLAVTLHDHWVFGDGGGFVTLKRAGLL